MTIEEKAAELKYIKNNLEISIRLSKALQNIYRDEYLKNALLLKGGTAIQFYLEEVKRLFFDLDMDFILSLEKKAKFQTHLIENMRKQGYEQISPKSRFSYSLDSYFFPYYLENGNLNYLKLDVNYSLNPHLYSLTKRKIKNDYFELEQIISLVNLEELIGMKLASLQESGQIKDVFDIYQILNSDLNLNIKKVQSAYIFYMVLANCQKLIEKTDKITSLTNHDMKAKLYPLIQKKTNPNLELMKKEVLSYVKECSILTLAQKDFINTFQEGHYHPEYLFSDESELENAKKNPIANWKMKVKAIKK
ncbi:MAG: nucleotidyl transferase AbiEii/AbiGii toxin family protein [Erysipelotrichaceae bacterium]|nr:nucleotidyl transferase AbiEii/AbiGii toxin family protein [Erysipelotrichaceae bacterium]